MRLSVVILNWNAAEDTAACVRSVRAWESHGGPSGPVISVVDNGSDPPGIAPIRREFPKGPALESLVNRGFAGGCNLGLRAELDHGSEALLLPNNAALVDASSVVALRATLESNPAIGVVGPTFWHRERCGSAGGRNVALYANTHLRPRVPPVAPRNVDYVPGTVALIRREVFDRVGLLDEDFFFPGEMADLCQRARVRGLRR